MRSDAGRSSQSSVSGTLSCWLCISIDRVVEDMLAHPELPPGLIERCLDVLKEIMPSERDLIRVIVEIVVELRESEEEEEVADELPVRYISQVLDFADFVILCDSSTMTNRMFRKPPSAARNQRGR